MHRLTGGRFALGLGRGFDLLFDVMGAAAGHRRPARGRDRHLPPALARRGGVGHDGPAGSYPYLSQDTRFDEDIPVLLMAIGAEDARARRPGRRRRRAAHLLHRRDPGPRGRDHPRGAEAAGRDPASVRVWSVLATVEDSIPEEAAAAQDGRPARDVPPGVRRGAGPRQRLGPGGARAVPRPTTLVQGYPGAFDAIGTVEQLSHLRDDVLPAEWLAASATGSAAAVRRGASGPVRRRRRQRDPARRDPDRARAGPGRVARDPTGRAGPAPRQPRTNALGERQEEPLQLVELLLASPRPCGPPRAARPR